MKNPFGRLNSKQEKEYASLRQSLIDAKISTRSAARELMKNIRNRALAISGVILLIVALTTLLLPELKIGVMLIAGLCLLWLVGTTLKGYRLIGRYIREEFTDDA